MQLLFKVHPIIHWIALSRFCLFGPFALDFNTLHRKPYTVILTPPALKNGYVSRHTSVK